MTFTESKARELLAVHGQNHVMRFWSELDESRRSHLLGQIATVDFPLVQKLVDTWVKQEPAAEHFKRIDPVPVIPPATFDRADARDAWAAGEDALRSGRVGLILVAGGQGTRLGFPGPKGAYPIGPLTQKSIFAYHAEKVLNLQRRYGCTLPWYIMVSDTNNAETQAYFRDNGFFGLDRNALFFFQQAMMPSVDRDGKLLLESKGSLAMNPNGHGGSIPATVDNGIVADAKSRGVDTLSYFQVDNWAVKVADPFFIGYHILGGGEMSSKVHRKNAPRESVGVHCMCDGEYRVIEYSELDIYPQLLETDEKGRLLHFAGNPAIHIISTDFIERVYEHFDQFPWHMAHKKVPYINASGDRVAPDKPNAYKFETFVFDALRFTTHKPIALEIHHLGEYTPTKQFDGDNSVVAARRRMSELWAQWLEAAGTTVPRDEDGYPAVQIEISPLYALDKEEFVAKSDGRTWPADSDLVINAEGEVELPVQAT